METMSEKSEMGLNSYIYPFCRSFQHNMNQFLEVFSGLWELYLFWISNDIQDLFDIIRFWKNENRFNYALDEKTVITIIAIIAPTGTGISFKSIVFIFNCQILIHILDIPCNCLENLDCNYSKTCHFLVLFCVLQDSIEVI